MGQDRISYLFEKVINTYLGNLNVLEKLFEIRSRAWVLLYHSTRFGYIQGWQF